jgi:hypothetical protein
MTLKSSFPARIVSTPLAATIFPVLVLLLMSSPLRADTLVNYSVSGSLPATVFNYDGTTPIPASSLSGTIQVNQTTQTITGDLFLTGGIVGEYIPAFTVQNFFYPNLFDLFAFDSTAESSSSTPTHAFPTLDLLLPGDLFTSNGATIPLITRANAALYENIPGITVVSSVGQGEGQFIDFESGSLTPADTAPVPEPSTFALMGTGLATLAAAFRRRIRI